MKNILALFIIIMFSVQLNAQSNLGFFHMSNGLPQGTNYNPSYFPESRAYLSLPVISGIDLSLNNSFGISDVFTETGDSTLIDINKFLGSQQKKNSFLNVNLGITDFMLGFRIGEKSHFSLFMNDKFDATFFYPIKLMNFVWQGNAAYVGQNFVADDMKFSTTYYREMGIGYAREFSIIGKPISIGARFKYLNGMLHSSSDDLALSIYTDESDYSLSATFNDAQIKSAAVSQLSDENSEIDASYFIFNNNAGFGMDLGARMQFTEKLGLGASVNDLGFIKWKENSEIINLSGSTFNYSGIDLDNTDNFGEALSDSLDNIQSENIDASFSTNLNARTYFTADYQLTNKGYAQATVANFITQGSIKTSMGLGYTQHVGRWFTASATTSYVPQQGVDLGLGMVFRLSSFQLYFSADNILNTINIPEASAANFKVGLNLLFGKADKKVKVKSTPVIEESGDANMTSPSEDADESDYSHLWK